MEKVRCEYCQQLNKIKRENCKFCGAPLPVHQFVSRKEPAYMAPYLLSGTSWVSGSAGVQLWGEYFQGSQLINLEAEQRLIPGYPVRWRFVGE